MSAWEQNEPQRERDTVAIEKPPIGIKPRKFVEEERIAEIVGAMRRYAQANRVVPLEWVAELAERLGIRNAV